MFAMSRDFAEILSNLMTDNENFSIFQREVADELISVPRMRRSFPELTKLTMSRDFEEILSNLTTKNERLYRSRIEVSDELILGPCNVKKFYRVN